MLSPTRALSLLVVTSSLFAGEVQSQPAPPGTGAGRFLAEWLSAYNGADTIALAVLKRQAPGVELPVPSSALATSRRFILDRVIRSSDLHVEFLLRDTVSPNQQLGVVAVAPGDPLRVSSFFLTAIPVGRDYRELLVSPEENERVVVGVADALRRHHVLPSLGGALADSVSARATRGAYSSISSARLLADLLTRQLRDVSGDRHLRVDFSVPAFPADFDVAPTPEMEARRRQQLRRANCAFVRVERLDGNIGLVKFNGFGAVQYCAATAAAALQFLSAVDALIVDLRDNNGGDPDMLTLWSSYFFSSRTHLTSMTSRDASTAQEIWTDDTLPGRLPDSLPVYVLTSRRTFSAGEAFAYQLQALKRATIVGEVTGGGARPSRLRRVTDHFAVNVAYARMVNPVTGTDWEGVGVQPDVRVPEGDAFEAARRLATARLSKPR